MIPHLQPTDSLSKEDLDRGLKAIIHDGLATHAMVTLTGGIFLVAFALQLGASNAVIGLIAAIPPLISLIQIPGAYLVDRIRNRRLICMITSFSGRALWIPIALTPFIVPDALALPVFIALLVVYAMFSAIGHCSWSSWMRDLIPKEILGGFFSRRMAISMVLGIALSLAASLFIDTWNTGHPETQIVGYSFLFCVGVIPGMIGIIFLARIPEPRAQPCDQTSFLVRLRRSLADNNLRNLLVFLGLWNFAVNLAAPFFTVYLLKNLGLDLTTVIALAIISQLVSVASLHLWGRVADQFSNKSVLQVSGPLFMLCILGWTFTTLPEKYILTMPLLVVLHVLMGISTAGVTLASGNIGLKLATENAATAQLATINMVNSMVAGIAPIIGGIFVDFFTRHELNWVLIWKGEQSQISFMTLSLQNWDFFFFFAFIIGLYSLHRLAYVREDGDARNRVVVHELVTQVRREMRNISTAGGLRYMLQIPLTADKKKDECGDAAEVVVQPSQLEESSGGNAPHFL